MHNVYIVLRREFLQRVTKKSFWIGTALFPVLMGLFAGAPMLLLKLRDEKPKRIAIVDAGQAVGPALSAALADRKLTDGRPAFPVDLIPNRGDLDTARAEFQPRIESGDLFGVVTIGPDLEAKDAFRFYGKNVSNIQVLEPLRAALRNVIVGIRLERSSLAVDRATLDRITADVDLETFQVSEGGDAKKRGFLEAYFGTFAYIMVLYMSLLIYGVAMMRGLLEEKSSRVMEVLLGSVTPDQLMTGKILGIGLVGLTQLSTYVVTAVILRVYLGSATAGSADMAGILSVFSIGKLLWFVVFFVLGYFLFVALFAVVGAVCNTEEEAQNLQTPVMLCLVLPLVATIFFVTQPDSPVAVVTSMIPLFAPLVMFMRIVVLTPPLWQILLSIALLLVTIYLLFKGVAKVFRIGILMYGKRPTVPEILRWARS